MEALDSWERDSDFYARTVELTREGRIEVRLPDLKRPIDGFIEAKAETIEREIFLGTFDPARHFPREAERQRLTIRQLYDEWRKKKAADVSPLTLEWYCRVVEGDILPALGSKYLDDFTPVVADRFKAGLVGRRLGPRTVNIVLARLKEMLRMAEDRRYTAETLSRWIVFQRQRRPEIQPLDFEEKDRLLKALPLRWRPYFEIASGTGLRPSEQVALTWERIDLKRNVIEVREGWRSGQPTRLKTAASHRDVDILPPVRKALEKQRLIAGGSKLVFPNPQGGHVNAENPAPAGVAAGPSSVPSSRAATSMPRGTPSRRTHSRRGRIRAGWRGCSATRRSRCSSPRTTGTSRI